MLKRSFSADIVTRSSRSTRSLLQIRSGKVLSFMIAFILSFSLVGSSVALAGTQDLATEEATDEQLLIEATEEGMDQEPKGSELYPQADRTITNKTTSWTNGTYTLNSDVTIASRIKVSGTVVLQLEEGCTLNAQAGIQVNMPNKLIIQGKGTLNASSPNTAIGLRNAVIGGDGETSANMGNGVIEILSGTVNVSRPMGATNVTGAGIGSGQNGVSGSVLIRGGNVNVYTDNTPDGYGAAIGQGAGENGGDITVEISGGTIVAHAVTGSCAIGGTPRGGGFSVYALRVAITGGKVFASANGFNSAIDTIRNNDFSLGISDADTPNDVQLYVNRIDSNLVENNPGLNGLLFIGDEGTAYGNSMIKSDMTIAQNQRFSIANDATFLVPTGISFIDEGVLENNGSITNEGSIIGSGTFVNNGTVTGPGTLFPQEIIFDTNGGSAIAPKRISWGTTIGPIEAPVREGYRFDGWFTDSSLSTPWNTITDPVESPLVLYAKWVADPVEDTTKPTDPVPPEQPTQPEQPTSPDDPSDEIKDDETDSGLIDDSDEESKLEQGTDNENDTGTVNQDPGSTLPQLSDYILLLPIIFGSVGILIFLCIDNARRFRTIN